MENLEKKVVCRYDTNIKYVGNIPNLFRDESIWNCTDFARDFEGKFLYVIQPLYSSEIMSGYTGLQVLALTEQQLIDNFVVLDNNKEYPIKAVTLNTDEMKNIQDALDKLNEKNSEFDEY